MQEYRIYKMTPELFNTLEQLNLSVVEETFKKKDSWLVYSDLPLGNVLDAAGVEYVQHDVQSTGWDTLWRDYLSDGWLTDSVYYCFEDKKFEDNRARIQINPAFAFGTGGHATTQIAAKLLEPIVKGQTVLDIGTGSGILAILASMKGAKNVYACDIDPVALPNTKENIKLNNISNVHIWAGGVESFNQSANQNNKPTVVVANIITSVLVPLHPHVLNFQPKYFVYSGILRREGTEFFSKIRLHGYKTDEIIHQNEWCGVRFKQV